MTPNTLTERLRGLIRVPVNDGAGLLDGKDFFERSFPTSNLAREAADRIEALDAALRGATYENDRLQASAGMAQYWREQYDLVRAHMEKVRAALASEQDK